MSLAQVLRADNGALVRTCATMDELLPHLTSGLFLAVPGFRLHALCTLLLVLKMHAVGIWTGVVRSRRGLRPHPEDAL